MSLYLNHYSVEEIEVLDKLVLIDKDCEIAERTPESSKVTFVGSSVVLDSSKNILVDGMFYEAKQLPPKEYNIRQRCDEDVRRQRII